MTNCLLKFAVGLFFVFPVVISSGWIIDLEAQSGHVIPLSHTRFPRAKSHLGLFVWNLAGISWGELGSDFYL